jgi:hypothetical protein
VDRSVLVVAEQVPQAVGKALDLEDPAVLHPPRRADDRVAGTDEDVRVGVDRPRPVLEPADEAVVQAAEARLPRVAQVQVGEQAPDAHRQVADERLLDPAEPADEARGQPPGDAVGEQEVDVLLHGDPRDRGAERHHGAGPLKGAAGR